MVPLDIFFYFWLIYYFIHIILFGRDIIRTRCFQERIHYYYNYYKDEDIVIKHPNFEDFRLDIVDSENQIQIYEI